MQKSTVLIVEDERDILDVLDFNLRQAGFKVLKTTDGGEGLRLAQTERPDLVVLDLMLPGMDGKEVCRRLRQNEATRGLPILMLTALASETDRIIGFELGADDYLTKPFSPRELVLRAQAILRRAGEPEEGAGPLRLGGLVIDPERHSAEVEGRELGLTATEFRLLHHLARHAGKVQTREVLLERVWGYAYEGYARTVDTHIRRLRKKLGHLAEHIETVRGIGYRFQEHE
jgi:two-component system phosphate regulon response regulator PhoB